MKAVIKTLIVSVAMLALAGFGGCASAPQTPQQGVYAAKSSYAVALTIAVAYKNLPPCGAGAPVLCSDPKIVATLQKVDTASSALLDAAENTVRTPGAGANAQTAVTAAIQAVSAFTTITSTLATK